MDGRRPWPRVNGPGSEPSVAAADGSHSPWTYRDQVDGAELGSELVVELPGAGESFEPSLVMWKRKWSPSFLPFLTSFFSSRVPRILAVALVPTTPVSLVAATDSRNFFWGSVSLTPGAFLGAAFLAPALGVALASALLGAAFLGAAFLSAGLAFSVFVPLLGAVDFFTAIAITSLLNMFACLRPALIERSLRQFIPNL